MSGNHVVVGGGIAGILSAILLAKQGESVTLIENSPCIGGLLNSREQDGFGWFDNGAHILSETGISEIDKLIFEECYSENWLQHSLVTSCVYFHGKKSNTVFIDARVLPEYQKAFKELMSLPRSNKQFKNLADRIEATYGKTLSENLYAPVMRKFTGLSLKELSSDAHHLFGMNRIICGTEEEARQWKKNNSWNDARLAFHDQREKAPKSLHFYPKDGGIGLWVVSMEKLLRKLGVKILTKTSIRKTTVNEGKVTSIVVDDEEVIPCDKLVWSVPVFLLLKTAGLDVLKLEAPSLCKVVLIDVVLDKPLQLDEFYLTCCDLSYSFFRMTNYYALNGKPKKTLHYRATFEFIVPPNESQLRTELTSEGILSELKRMGLVKKETKLIASWRSNIEAGFPQPTPAFNKTNKKLADIAKNKISNLLLIGRSSGKSFFMKDVLTEVHDLLS